MKKIISIITSALLALMYLIPTSLLGVVSADDSENTKPTQIEFCQMSFILDYKYYSGIYLDSNRDVYSFGIDNVTEDWNLYGNYSETPIKLTDSMPQEGLLNYLGEHPECCKLIGKTSIEDYSDYKSELEQIDLTADMEYRLFAEPAVVGLGHVERFAIQYDDNGNRQIVFLSGGLSAENDLYLENPDFHASALNDKMIQYEKINEPTTTGTTTSSTTETTTTSCTTQFSTESTTANTDTTTSFTTETTTTSCTTQFSTESTTANSLSSTTTVATIKYFASEDKFCEMAIKDYKEKVGITPATADANANDNGTISIRLLDEEETILDTYVIDQVTGQGTNQSGEEVNLPQTGYSDIYKVITGLAALMTVSGAAIIVKTKKETE